MEPEKKKKVPRRSTFAVFKKRPTGRFKPKSRTTTDLSRQGGLDGAGASTVVLDTNEVMKEGLQVTLRVEINQRDPSGRTKAYGFSIPALKCEK